MVKVDLLALPYADDYFDLLIANHVLEHVEDDRRAVAEIARVLKPGGYAILQTPYSDCPRADMGGFRYPLRTSASRSVRAGGSCTLVRQGYL